MSVSAVAVVSMPFVVVGSHTETTKHTLVELSWGWKVVPASQGVHAPSVDADGFVLSPDPASQDVTV